MRNPRIFTPTPLAAGSIINLPESAAIHVSKVLRMKPNERLILFNNQDGSFQGKITATSNKHVSVELISWIENNSESPLRIELGQVISRGERMDYAVQKSTEMGITEITPLFSQRCEVKLSTERQQKRLKHWQQIAICACEQSGRNKVPTILQPTTLSEWIKNRTTNLNFVLHHRTSKKLDDYTKPQSVSLLIGPEGGLAQNEIQQAEANHFNPLSIGPRVLRTETAPIVAASIMHYLWGDFR
ncbi:MAG: 16S rRNA (uracil(1498)-N(3))-methyltransferase [Candidatus Endonucleobacter sp. (ex Gigantidas childressi)]|nr:16S rRNA (uracil(1498)-N(3))-methyltransferase [Candidatus Endonucleobacter sp. (ex Gigantidas childressi)]